MLTNGAWSAEVSRTMLLPRQDGKLSAAADCATPSNINNASTHRVVTAPPENTARVQQG
jgi:hypothetical protein